MKSVVVGLGEFGYAAAVALARSGAEVIAIDREMHFVESIKDDVSLAVCCDASNRAALEAHDVGEADVFLAAIGRNFEAQVLAVVHAARLGVPRIVARAVTTTHAEILREVGATEVLNPEEAAARRVVQGLLAPDVTEYFELADGFSLAEAEAPPGAVGRSLLDLELRKRYRLNVVGIKRPDPKMESGYRFDPIPDPKKPLLKGEILALVGSDLDIAHFVTALKK
ncbi:MAG: TrkA family potassium uptake protein [Planctomycetes bacterium]|nr:TrkA family potassium uptake protein [Planctomycetota bacterium]